MNFLKKKKEGEQRKQVIERLTGSMKEEEGG